MKKALIFSLLPILSLAAGAQQSSPYTGVAVSDIEMGNDYYIYNVESGLWLQNNNTKTFDWTTRAAIGMYGLDWTITVSPWDASGYAIGAKFGKPSIWADDNYIDWHDDGSTWMITPVSVDGVPNACKITCGNITMGTVRYAEGESRRSTNILTETTNDRWYLENPDFNRNKDGDASYQQRAVWQLVTKAERLQYLKDNASESNPLDATWLIGDPDFSANNQRESMWNLENVGWTANNDCIGNADNDESRGVRAKELWRPAGDNTFDFYQVLNDVPDGKYRFTLQGFTRHGDGSLGDADEHTVYYYAGGVSHKMKSIFADGRDASSGNFVDNIDGKFIPNSTDRASKAINSENAYVNEEIEATVTNGTLRIGVRRENGSNKNDWTVIDNFKLTYLGGYCELNENNDNSGINETAYVVKLNRALTADKWNTFCVPFNMEKSKLGASAEVKKLKSAVKNGDNYTMTFEDAATIEAGVPYMVKVADGEYEGTIELANVAGIAVNTTGTPSVTKDDVTFTGVYASGKAPNGSFIISNNNFYLVNSDVNLKAFRGYITVPAEVKALNFVFEDDATAIESIQKSKFKIQNDEAIYNLSGQRLNKMQKGINIVNGKKMVIGK